MHSASRAAAHRMAHRVTQCVETGVPDSRSVVSNLMGIPLMTWMGWALATTWPWRCLCWGLAGVLVVVSAWGLRQRGRHERGAWTPRIEGDPATYAPRRGR